MNHWRLETSAEFDRAARKLDRETLRRIKHYLDEVLKLDDPRDRGRGLTANLSQYWRYRIGDYRVIVEVRDRTLVVLAIGLGHRSEIYRKAERVTQARSTACTLSPGSREQGADLPADPHI